jgi:hypothetical protein
MLRRAAGPRIQSARTHRGKYVRAEPSLRQCNVRAVPFNRDFFAAKPGGLQILFRLMDQWPKPGGALTPARHELTAPAQPHILARGKYIGVL